MGVGKMCSRLSHLESPQSPAKHKPECNLPKGNHPAPLTPVPGCVCLGWGVEAFKRHFHLLVSTPSCGAGGGERLASKFLQSWVVPQKDLGW